MIPSWINPRLPAFEISISAWFKKRTERGEEVSALFKNVVWILDHFKKLKELSTYDDGTNILRERQWMSFLLSSLEDVEELAGPLAVVQVEGVVALRRRGT